MPSIGVLTIDANGADPVVTNCTVPDMMPLMIGLLIVVLVNGPVSVPPASGRYRANWVFNCWAVRICPGTNCACALVESIKVSSANRAFFILGPHFVDGDFKSRLFALVGGLGFKPLLGSTAPTDE